MKRTMYILVLVLVLSAGALYANTNNPVTDLHVALSPFSPIRYQQQTRTNLYRLVLTSAAPGCSVTVWDGFEATMIAKFAIPALKPDSARGRAQKLANGLGELGRWLGRVTNAAAPGEFKDSCALNTPRLIERLTSESGQGHRALLLLGSPFQRSPSEPSFDMTNGNYPSDAHVLASLEESIYGVAGRTNRLGNVSVSWVIPSEQVWETEIHRVLVRRFWAVWFGAQGGKLVRFDADFGEAFVSAFRGDMDPVITDQIETGGKLEMRLARPREVPRWIPQTVPATNEVDQTTNSAVSNETARKIPQPTAGNTHRPEQRPEVAAPVPSGAPSPNTELAVGLMWQGFITTDIDLYVSMPGEPELSFKKTRHARGFYHHDYKSPNWVKDGERSRMSYEFVELQRPVDIRTIRAWINYYSGFTPTPSGTVVVWWRGRQYISTFQIPAIIGNHGGDAARRESSACWVEIDLLKIVGINP